jgi:hypothetical protein
MRILYADENSYNSEKESLHTPHASWQLHFNLLASIVLVLSLSLVSMEQVLARFLCMDQVGFSIVELLWPVPRQPPHATKNSLDLN